MKLKFFTSSEKTSNAHWFLYGVSFGFRTSALGEGESRIDHLFKSMSTVCLAQCLPHSIRSINVWRRKARRWVGMLKKQRRLLTRQAAVSGSSKKDFG